MCLWCLSSFNLTRKIHPECRWHHVMKYVLSDHVWGVSWVCHKVGCWLTVSWGRMLTVSWGRLLIDHVTKWDADRPCHEVGCWLTISRKAAETWHSSSVCASWSWIQYGQSPLVHAAMPCSTWWTKVPALLNIVKVIHTPFLRFPLSEIFSYLVRKKQTWYTLLYFLCHFVT